MGKEHIIFSEPAITTAAKDFLDNGEQSVEYKKATNKAVSEVVSAIKFRINKSTQHNIKVRPRVSIYKSGQTRRFFMNLLSKRRKLK